MNDVIKIFQEAVGLAEPLLYVLFGLILLTTFLRCFVTFLVSVDILYLTFFRY